VTLFAMSWASFSQLVIVILLLYLVAHALIGRWHRTKWGDFSDEEPANGRRR
jgi:hypothetical protein